MIFLTGCSGFLGRQLLGRLLMAYPNEQFAVLLRSQFGSAADARLKSLLTDEFGTQNLSKLLHRVTAISGDVTLPGLGMDSYQYQTLAKRIHKVVHCAASTSFEQALPDARIVNVGGTQHILDFAKLAVEAVGKDNFRYFHVSTAYVAGATSGVVDANRLNLDGVFRNAYEQSKAEAEGQVRAVHETIPSVILRPSIIVGDSVTGQTSAFNVIYIPARMLMRGLFRALPIHSTTVFDVVPVDYVADALTGFIALNPDAGTSFHICAGVGRECNWKDILEAVRLAYETVVKHAPFHVPPLLSPDSVNALLQSIYAASDGVRQFEKLVSRQLGVFRRMLPLLPYADQHPQFDVGSTDRLLGNLVSPPPLFPQYAERVFRYCLETNWGKRPWSNPLNARPWYERPSLLYPGLISN